jgi:hypothetical protein
MERRDAFVLRLRAIQIRFERERKALGPSRAGAPLGLASRFMADWIDAIEDEDAEGQEDALRLLRMGPKWLHDLRRFREVYSYITVAEDPREGVDIAWHHVPPDLRDATQGHRTVRGTVATSGSYATTASREHPGAAVDPSHELGIEHHMLTGCDHDNTLGVEDLDLSKRMPPTSSARGPHHAKGAHLIFPVDGVRVHPDRRPGLRISDQVADNGQGRRATD